MAAALALAHRQLRAAARCWWRSARPSCRRRCSAERRAQLRAQRRAAAARELAARTAAQSAAQRAAPARRAGPAAVAPPRQRGCRPTILPVPYGADALGGARLEVIRQLLYRLARQKVERSRRRQELRRTLLPRRQRARRLFAGARRDAVRASCDLVGNPSEEALSALQRTPLALANLIGEVRASTRWRACRAGVGRGRRQRAHALSDARGRAHRGRLEPRGERQQPGRDPRALKPIRSPPCRPADEDFRPSRWLRNPHLQSMLASTVMAARPRAARALRRCWRQQASCCSTAARACACSASCPRRRTAASAAVVLLHGWEGSAESLYVLSLAQRLFERRFEVVRLNLRDHGETHHLNRELFHSCRLPEVVGAVRALQQLSPGRAAAAGRLLARRQLHAARGRAGARRASEPRRRDRGVAGARPGGHAGALQRGMPGYERYFVRKWLRSLRKKQAAWPDVYDFSDVARLRDLKRMTAELVRSHTEFRDAGRLPERLRHHRARLAHLEVPARHLHLARRPDHPGRRARAPGAAAGALADCHALRRALRLLRAALDDHLGGTADSRAARRLVHWKIYGLPLHCQGVSAFGFRIGLHKYIRPVVS